MKYLVLAGSLVLAGCQAARPVPLPVPPRFQEPPAVVAPVPVPSPPPDLERNVRQQAQYIDALLSQNDALRATLAMASAPKPEVTPEPEPAPTVPLASPPTAPGTGPVHAPNAEGVIDLVAVAKPAAGEPVNPFAVRTATNASGREVSVRVGGIIAGPVACAVINDRLVEAGETVESFTVERVESDAVLLRHGEHRLRLPVSESNVRVRLPL